MAAGVDGSDMEVLDGHRILKGDWILATEQ